MATNDFLPFATAAGANVLTQSDYASLAAVATGYQSGIAKSQQLNKTWRQSSIMAAVVAQFIADQTGQNAVDDGTTATLLANLKAAVLASAGHGQCRLSAASSTSLKLAPYNGNKLVINGVVQTIPAAGVSVSNAGLAGSTLYYVYAAMSGGSMVLNIVTTSHVTAPNGVEVKNGDATQTLVGMILTNSSSQFVDTALSRAVLNWFNRRTLVATSSTGSASFNNSGLAEITTAARNGFLCWGDEVCVFSFAGLASNSASGAGATVLAVGILDGPSIGPTVAALTPYAANNASVSNAYSAQLSEGNHYSSVAGGLATGGTGSATVNISLFTTIRG